MTNQSSGSDTTRQVVIAIVAGLILAAIVGCGHWIIHEASSHFSHPNETATSAYTPPMVPTSSVPAPRSAYAAPSPTPRNTFPSSSPTPVDSSAASAGVTPQYLADLTALPDDTPDTTPQEMSGVYYAHAVSTSSGGCDRNQQDTFSYVINGKYSWFQAVVGLDDQSLDGVQVQIEVFADSRSLLSRTFTPGQVVHLRSSIIGVREIKLEQTYLAPNPGICSESATAVWGNAEVLP